MFELPKLQFNYSDLEPYIDAKTMEIHHSKHHQAYIDNLNKALEGHSDLQNKDIESILKEIDSVPEDIRQQVINNGGGHHNHTFFWSILGQSKFDEEYEVVDAIKDTFGNMDEFKKTMNENGLKRFGSGWVWLVRNKDGELQVYSTPNQESPLMKGDSPVIGIDVWEHAYYLKYQNRRAEYLENVWSVLNWEKINSIFIS